MFPGTGLARYSCHTSQVVLVVKNQPASAGDLRDTASIPGFSKIPWSREWQPSPIYFPGESHGQRNLAYYIVHGVAKSWTRLKWFSKYSVIASEQLVESMDSGKMLGRVSEEFETFGHFNFLFLEICQALFYGCYTLNTSVFYVFLTCSITIGFLLIPCMIMLCFSLNYQVSPSYSQKNPQTFQHNKKRPHNDQNFPPCPQLSILSMLWLH